MERKPGFTTFRNRSSSNDRSKQQSPATSKDHDSMMTKPAPADEYYGRSAPSSSAGPREHSHYLGGSSQGYKSGREPRHPPWLKGKQIGLYYRDLYYHKQRHMDIPSLDTSELKAPTAENFKSSSYKGPHHWLPIELSPENEKEIQDLLSKVRSADESLPVSSPKKEDLPSTSSACQKTECGGFEQLVESVKEEESERKVEIDQLRSAFTEPLGEPACAAVKGSSIDDWQTVTSKPRKEKQSTVSEDQKENKEESQGFSCDQYKNVQDSAFKRNFLQSITESIEAKLDRIMRSRLVLHRNPELDQELIDRLIAKHNNPKYKEMLSFREKLPSYKIKNKILDLIRKNQVVVISGETGCGKTTQLAQFILDEEIMENRGSTCHIICTQPRRISAVSVARRVAQERAEALGDSVGYQIRLEKQAPKQQGSILYCTTGVLLQFMQTDPALRHVSHLVLDEIHERDTVCDFVITLLRNVIPKRPDLKLVLMSATLNADHFSKYYDNAPCINIPGFTFPVKEYYLEDVLEKTGFEFSYRLPKASKDHKWRKHTSSGKLEIKKAVDYADMISPYIRSLDPLKYSKKTLLSLQIPDSEELNCDLVSELITHICNTEPDGAILVFLPGWSDISNLNNTLLSRKIFNSSNYLIIALHSMMPTTAQQSVFDRPPRGVRKIILSTNIAETSITIDDIVYVIDTGKIKMKQYDVESNIQTLLPQWVSLANARQRRGRAGRVQPGICYHLYTRAREMTFDNYPLPEMLRTRLEEVILMAKIHQVGPIKPFLSRVMNPPDQRAVNISVKLLYTMNAIDSNENLTPLGYHLAQLPLDPHTGKMILMAALFSCVDPIFSIAASLSFKDAFVIPLGKEKLAEQRKLMLSDNSLSDHLLLADIMRRWEKAVRKRLGSQFCWENFLSSSTLTLLNDMKMQFGRYLYDMKFLSSPDPKAKESNLNSKNRSLVKAIVCAGLYPNVAFVRPVQKRTKRGRIVSMYTAEDVSVQIHPKSINSSVCRFDSPFLVYHLKLRSSAVYLHDTTMVNPLPLLFFGESLVYFIEDGIQMVAVNDYIRFRCTEETANLIMELRRHLNSVLEHKVSHPDTIDWKHGESRECAIFRAIVELITFESKQRSSRDDKVDIDSEEDVV